jgi:hypothetical protein
VLVLRDFILGWYAQWLQVLFTRMIFVIVIEIGGVEDVEEIMSRGTPTRMCVGEGRLPKSLLRISF